MQAAIEVRAIGQRARSGDITLRDVSITVRDGELMAIIGGSGSGKTTLLDAMSGLHPPFSGAVERAPQSPDGRRGTGYVPADDTLHLVLPLGRALRYRAALSGAGGGQRAIEEALRVTGLRSRAAVPVGELNPGERKRAAIAAELLSRPALLFLEGPTAGLDPAQGAEVMRLLRRLRDEGTTVVLTTHNPLDAVRCDKVAVLATGGHLAFFGTPTAAREYFAADSLDEIYERLAGLGDPAAAWSRRFSHRARANGGFAASLTAAPQPGPARLVPDSAGPHSAGRPSTPMLADRAAPGRRDLPGDSPRGAAAGTAAAPVRASAPPGRTWRALRPARQLAVLTARNADVARRDRYAMALAAGVPLAVAATLLLLLASGGLGPARTNTVPMSWTLLGGFATGLAYGLPQIRQEAGVLRAERFSGLGAVAYMLAKAVLLLPALAAADAVILLVPALSGRLPEGYGPGYLTLLPCSVAALALALLLSAAASARPWVLRVLSVIAVPVVLLAAALLTLLDQPRPGFLALLGAVAAALLAAATALVARLAPAASLPR